MTKEFPERALPAKRRELDCSRRPPGKIDLFSEFLDLSRFPEKVHVERMAHFLAEKYAERRPSVVIAIGQDALGFIVANRQAIAPDAKIVFCCFSGAEATTMNLRSDVVGALDPVRHHENLGDGAPSAT